MKQMNYSNIFEKKVDKSLTTEEKKILKKILGKKISEEYWTVIQNYAGVYIKEEVCFKSIEKSKLTSENGYDRINKFLEFSTILKTIEIYREQIPMEYIPIAEKDGGNFLCVDSKTGYIYIWVHDEIQNKNMFLVAKSFETFINSLERVENEEQEEIRVVRSNFSSDFFDLLD